jgi:hypothetical protein
MQISKYSLCSREILVTLNHNGNGSTVVERLKRLTRRLIESLEDFWGASILATSLGDRLDNFTSKCV